MAEDVVEDFVGGDLTFSGDFGKGGEDLTEVFGNEVAAELRLQAEGDALQVFVGTQKGLVMAGVGNDDVGFLKFGDVGRLVDGLLQFRDVGAEFRGNGDDFLDARMG